MAVHGCTFRRRRPTERCRNHSYTPWQWRCAKKKKMGVSALFFSSFFFFSTCKMFTCQDFARAYSTFSICFVPRVTAETTRVGKMEKQDGTEPNTTRTRDWSGFLTAKACRRSGRMRCGFLGEVEPRGQMKRYSTPTMHPVSVAKPPCLAI